VGLLLRMWGCEERLEWDNRKWGGEAEQGWGIAPF